MGHHHRHLFGDDSRHEEAFAEVINVKEGHKAKLSHELIASAAAYEAAKAYQEHQARHGKPPSHQKAKEILCVVRR